MNYIHRSIINALYSVDNLYTETVKKILLRLSATRNSESIMGRLYSKFSRVESEGSSEVMVPIALITYSISLIL